MPKKFLKTLLSNEAFSLSNFKFQDLTWKQFFACHEKKIGKKQVSLAEETGASGWNHLQKA